MLRPREAVLYHERFAASSDALAQRLTGRQRLVIVRHTDGRVHAAQEQAEVARTLDLNQRPELMDFEPGLLLGVVAKRIRHVGQVVSDAAAHWNRDFLTSTRTSIPAAAAHEQR